MIDPRLLDIVPERVAAKVAAILKAWEKVDRLAEENKQLQMRALLAEARLAIYKEALAKHAEWDIINALAELDLETGRAQQAEAERDALIAYFKREHCDDDKPGEGQCPGADFCLNGIIPCIQAIAQYAAAQARKESAS